MTSTEVSALIDGYLLGRDKNRDAVFTSIASWQTALPAAQPIVRALARVGARAADESLLALRLILSGKPATDDAVLALRVLGRKAAAGDAQAAAQYHDLLT